MNRITLIIKPTHRCNLNCIYCYDAEKRSSNSETIDKDDLVYIIKEFYKKYDILHVVWHGGEPLIVGVDYLDYVMSKFKDDNISWSIQTNGTLLDEKVLELVNKYRITLGVSWDGITTKETRGVWLDLEKLSYLKSLLSSERLDFNLLHTVTKANAKYMIDDFLYAAHFGFLVSFSYEFGDYITKDDYKEISANEKKFFNFLCKSELAIHRPFDSFMDYYTRQVNVHMCNTCICPGRWFGVEPNGDIVSCGRVRRDGVVYGNLLKGDSVDDIAKSKGLKTLYSYKLQTLEKCRDCSLLRYCQNGCMVKNNDSNIFDPDLCEYMKNLYNDLTIILDENIKNNELKNQHIISLLKNSNNQEVRNRLHDLGFYTNYK